MNGESFTNCCHAVGFPQYVGHIVVLNYAEVLFMAQNS